MADGLAGGVEDGVGLAVEGFAAPEDAAEVAHGLAALGDGAAIALFEDAGHVLFGLGAQPDGEAFAEEEVVGGGVGDDAAASGEDEAAVPGKDALEGFALKAAVSCLAIEVEDDGEGLAGVGLNLLVEFNERAMQNLGEQGAQGGFAGAAEAGKGDTEAAERSVGATELGEEEFMGMFQGHGRKFFEKGSGLFKSRRGRGAFGGQGFDGHVKGVGEGMEASDGQTGVALFDADERAQGEGALFGELTLGETATFADGANAFTELQEVGVQGLE